MTSGSICNSGESNEELLRRCQGSDESALRELLRRHERPVYSVLYRMLGCREDAEEALADVFAKVWRSAGSFRGESKFTTWLYRIAGNTALDVIRSRKARAEVTIDDAVLTEVDLGGSVVIDPSSVLIRADELSALEQAMRRLSAGDRLLITLYHVKECSLQEIAEITGQKQSNLKVKLFRARQKLRVHIADLDRETNDEVQTGTTESIGLQPGPP